jgi:2-keto-4-pentenoate hydratase/2-oxohepta-3-ene-1,7-dioic acid hydratase in catechol pathway
MRLSSFRGANGPSYGVVTDRGIVDLGRRIGARYPDLRALIAGDALAEARRLGGEAPDAQLDRLELLPVIPNPDKIVCVGLNYEEHRVETNREKTEHPAVFLRLPESQVGHGQPLLLPPESTQLDYEGEIAVIIGRPGRRVPEARAWDHVIGYAPYNDGSIRDWQRHTVQWTAGKNFARTGGFGPWMVTADEIPPGTVLELTTRLNGQVMQHATTDMLIHSIPRLIAYISTWTTLLPGDVIVTGTPGGVGARRNPPVWMKAGDVVEVEVSKVGVLRNVVAAEER